MNKDKRVVDLFIESARAYARAPFFYGDGLLVERNHLHLFQIHLQTTFLFPSLSDKDRSILSRLGYLREWLGKAKAVNSFDLSPQNLKQFKAKIRQKKSERIKLKRRLARSGLSKKLTELQLLTVKERYLSSPASA
jgi:hypothetical protein